MYAQTLVYGLFVARYHDETSQTFTRQEARELIPPSNPFLQHFFDHIVGPDFDKRLAYIVNELCEVFSAADVCKLMGDYYDADQKDPDAPDPVIHFYEDFLKEYDAAQRLKLGAFYTPLPVVRFIVRAVDAILQKDFGLVDGLADTSKIERTTILQGRKVNEKIHKVQILDPAVGTGTFLNEVVKQIARRFIGQEGRWKSYVDSDLLPRLFGFELMMAPYTIAHLKVATTFRDTGYEKFSKRLGIYLTNSLEEAHEEDNSLFGPGVTGSIAQEALDASDIKNNKPIMVVLGNPPYSVSSANKGEWIQDMLTDYKKDLNEKKINLDDDYIKFIRFAEHFIEKNGEGIVAMITNNSYIDGITHRQMRKHLLETFDDIYILDLHGDAKKKEIAPNGDKDENVFDIQQGVAIAIFVRKSRKKKELGAVYHSEFWGKREEKYDALEKGTLTNVKWTKLDYSEPYYFFVPKNFGLRETYEKGFRADDLMQLYNSGIQTKRDGVCISFTDIEQQGVVANFINLENEEIRKKYDLPPDGRDWKIDWAKNDLRGGYEIIKILYRPFDFRSTVYTGHSKGFLAYPREKTSSHFFHRDNLGLILNRQHVNFEYSHVGITRNVICHGTFYLGNKGQDYLFPLYLYANDGTKVPNLKKEIVEKIKEHLKGEVVPEDILDYIYAVLHSPTYRTKYKEFLRIDFPRVPYPKDDETFWKLVEKGRELRGLHLMESPVLSKFITTFPVAGDNLVEKLAYKDGNVYINKTQYFGNVPEIAWSFYIGGYQPAQKWLKDRKGRTLSSDDLVHYQKTIIALTETDRIMKEIDNISFL